MSRLILSNARLVLPGSVADGSVILEGDRISEIALGRRYSEAIDLNGEFLMPGMIDIHTDYLEKELHPRPSACFPMDFAFHLMDLRAVSCGITTVLGAARFAALEKETGAAGTWKGSGMATAEAWEKLRETALARHRIHIRWDPSLEPAEPVLDRILSLDSIGNLVFNDAAPGERQFRNLNLVEKWAKELNISSQEAEHRLKVRRASARAANNRKTVQRIVGGTIPLGSHDDTTIEQVDEAWDCGATLSEMPCTIEAARRAKQLGMTVAMGSPNYYRGGSHCGNLSCQEALVENLVDILCSDFHFPSMLASIIRMAEGGTPLNEAARLVTVNPARHLGIDRDFGCLVMGQKADLISFSAQPSFGVVSHVWVDGEPRFRQSHPLSSRRVLRG